MPNQIKTQEDNPKSIKKMPTSGPTRTGHLLKTLPLKKKNPQKEFVTLSRIEW